jgi:hypothetical protein
MRRQEADKFVAIWRKELLGLLPVITNKIAGGEGWYWYEAPTKSSPGYIPLVDGGGDIILATSAYDCIEAGYTGLIKPRLERWHGDAFADSDVYDDGSEFDTPEEFVDDWLRGCNIAFKFRVCFHEEESIATSTWNPRFSSEAFLHFDCYADPSEYQSDKGTLGSCVVSVKLDDMTRTIARGIAIKQAEYFKTTILGL